MALCGGELSRELSIITSLKETASLESLDVYFLRNYRKELQAIYWRGKHKSNNENCDALGILIQIGLEKMTHLQEVRGSDQSSTPDRI